MPLITQRQQPNADNSSCQSTFPIPSAKWVLTFNDTSTGNTLILPIIMEIQIRQLFICKSLHVGWKGYAVFCKLFHLWKDILDNQGHFETVTLSNNTSVLQTEQDFSHKRHLPCEVPHFKWLRLNVWITKW